MSKQVDPRIPEELREWYRGAEDGSGERMTGLRSECRREHRAMLLTGSGRVLDAGVIGVIRCAHLGDDWIAEEDIGQGLEPRLRVSAVVGGLWTPIPITVSWDEAEGMLLDGTLGPILTKWLSRPVISLRDDLPFVAPVRAL